MRLNTLRCQRHTPVLRKRLPQLIKGGFRFNHFLRKIYLISARTDPRYWHRISIRTIGGLRIITLTVATDDEAVFILITRAAFLSFEVNMR